MLRRCAWNPTPLPPSLAPAHPPCSLPSFLLPTLRSFSLEAQAQRAEGNAGTTRVNGRTWELDFSQGAKSLSVAVPDHVLPGSVDKIRVRARGAAGYGPYFLAVKCLGQP